MVFHIKLFGKVFRFSLYLLEGFELEEYRRWKKAKKAFVPYEGH